MGKSKDKFTPGTWKIGHGGLDGDTHFSIVGDNEADLDARGLIAEYGVPAPRPSEEVIANARLIAAAPSLLSALRGMLNMPAPHTASAVEEQQEIVRAARAAVAKAEGC